MLSGLVRSSRPHITAVVNVGDDMVMHGLPICPDLDTFTYTLAGMDNPETGWGVAGESWRSWRSWSARRRELVPPGRPRSGHPSLPHPAPGAGDPLSDVTAELARPAAALRAPLPVTDDPLRTVLTLADDTLGPAGTDVSFQDYFVRLHHDVAVRGVRFGGPTTARPAPGVLEAIGEADRIIVCPSNPIVSIGPLLAVPGVREALDGAARRRRGGVTHRGRGSAQGTGRPSHDRARHGALGGRRGPALRAVGGHAGH